MSSLKKLILKILKLLIPESIDGQRTQINYLKYKMMSFAEEGKEFILERAIG